MKIIEKRISEIQPYENNPRNNDAAVDAVAASIKEFGFKVPIIIDKDNVIVAGHTRLKAAEKLGLAKVPTIMADDLTEKQVKAFRLADNKTAELANWIPEKLEEELADLADVDMSQYGFEELEAALDGLEIIEDDYEPEPPEEPKTKLGDIFRLGRHKLMCGDSTDADAIKILMGGATADLVCTDPPYNVALGKHMRPSEAIQLHRRTDGLVIDNDEMADEDFVEFLRKATTAALSQTRAGGAFYIWFASNRTLSVYEAMARAKLTVRQELVWVKSAFALGRQDYQWRHEPCIYGWKDGAAHYFKDDRTESTVIDQTPNFEKMKKEELVDYINRILETTSVLYEQKPSRSELHPTMKPVKLIGRLIANSSQRGENVLDSFGGSGTTMIACEQLGRNCFMMELDPHYCDVIIDRWEQFTGEKAEKIN